METFYGDKCEFMGINMDKPENFNVVGENVL